MNMNDERFTKLADKSKFKINGKMYIKINDRFMPIGLYKMLVKHAEEDAKFIKEYRKKPHKVVGIEEDGTIILED